MSSLMKGLALLLVTLAVGLGLVVWKSKVGGSSHSALNQISREEIEMLLGDLAKTNPMALKQLSQNPDMKKEQLDNLKQLLSFATMAQRENFNNKPEVAAELRNIRAEVIAVNYDREINKDKGPMPPFGFITEDQVKGFWGADQSGDFFTSLKNRIGLGADQEQEFQKFLDSKVALMKENNPQMKDRELSEEEKTQARDFFAKIEIYNKEFQDKVASGSLPKEFVDKVNLQVKLQQAQFLARTYSDKVGEEAKVTDDEVAKYVAEHPELNQADKRSKAEEVLQRAKSGEDFAKLANEFTEDPGNKGPKNEGQGGIYKDVTKGRMVKPFEEAALALEPGQVSPQLVESDFGYHIIKLERKGESKDPSGQPTETYDVRHILFSNGYKDPADPDAHEVPVKVFVRTKLETEKRKAVLDKIIASANVSVPEDFTVPEVTEEQIKEAMEQQQRRNAMPSAEPGENPVDAKDGEAKGTATKPAKKGK